MVGPQYGSEGLGVVGRLSYFFTSSDTFTSLILTSNCNFVNFTLLSSFLPRDSNLIFLATVSQDYDLREGSIPQFSSRAQLFLDIW